MSASQNGEQVVTFDFRQEATSDNFNKYSANILKPGIYKGGRVRFEQYVSSGLNKYRYVIEPFTAAFLIPESTSITSKNKKLLVNVSTNSEAIIESGVPTNTDNIETKIPGLGNSFFLTMKLDWIKAINNFITFGLLTNISLLASNELILCRLEGNGSNLKPEIIYDYTSFGSFYESYDDKFTNYNEGIKTISSNYGNTISLNRRFIPYSSDSYYLELTSFSNSQDFHFISFQQFNGELEVIDSEDYRQNVKFIFNVNGDVNVISSAKMLLAKGSSRVVGFLTFNLDEYKRLSLYNGFSVNKKYIIKTNIYNFARRLNTSNSLD